MRRPSPAFILTSVVLALASTAAGAVTTTTTTSTGTTTSTATAPRATTGGCTGTGGSSCSTTSASTATTSGATTGSTSSAAGETLSGQNVTAPAPSTSTAATTTGTSTGLTANPTGTAVDTTRGANPLNPSTGFAHGFVVPGIVTDVGALGDVGNGVNANGERVAGNSGNAANNGAPLNSIVAGGNVFTLPLYDATTKAATAREIRRRERGQEPRVIGMAPRTDNDLTWQMPDDRIIRY